MAATIKIKNSSTASAVPTSSDLVQGELAVNVTDKRIFTENASGTVVELGTNPSSITLPAGSASAPTLLASGDTNTGIFFPAADTVGISTGGTERARVDSSGNWYVGKTTNDITNYGINTTGAGQTIYVTSNNTYSLQLTRRNGTGPFQYFNYNGTDIGTISTNGSTTAYNTTSDYRLKENVQPMTGALAKVAALKPCTYTWKSNGESGEGFIAHELAEVVPDAVHGEKDATRIEQYEISPAVPATFDEEGNELTPAVEAVTGEREAPVYQGIDTSFLVATLTAAIQELKAEFDAYKASHP